MQPVLEAEWILRQNTPFSQKAELMSLLEDSKEKVHSSLLDTLYKQINSVRRIDFAEIDKSKGIYSKLSFKEDLDAAHKCLEESGMCAKELATIKTAAHNIETLGKQFNEAYKLEVDAAILVYECTVLAVVDATSSLITKTASSVVKTKEAVPMVSLSVLGRFNTAVKKGSVQKMIKNVSDISITNQTKAAKEDFILGGLAVGAVAAGILVILPLVRELIYYFYYTRMKLANYLDQLKVYIKINEVEVKNNSKFDAEKKKSIIGKQDEWIARLDKISDKIRVNQALGEKTSKAEIKKSNSEITLKNVKDDIASSNSGFEFE